MGAISYSDRLLTTRFEVTGRVFASNRRGTRVAAHLIAGRGISRQDAFMVASLSRAEPTRLRGERVYWKQDILWYLIRMISLQCQTQK